MRKDKADLWNRSRDLSLPTQKPLKNFSWKKMWGNDKAWFTTECSSLSIFLRKVSGFQKPEQQRRYVAVTVSPTREKSASEKKKKGHHSTLFSFPIPENDGDRENVADWLSGFAHTHSPSHSIKDLLLLICYGSLSKWLAKSDSSIRMYTVVVLGFGCCKDLF